MKAQLYKVSHLILLLAIASFGAAAAPAGYAMASPRQQADSQPLSFETLVDCQEAIETVYWNHRDWPAGNGAAKPSLAQVLPRAALEARVLDTLRMSAALEDVWGRPITAGQLQAEMDRMARDSRDPARLGELFAALDNDPLLIAECLARPALATRLARSWYAADQRFQGDLTLFDQWWRGQAASQRAAEIGAPAAYRLPVVSAGSSTADFWLPTQSLPQRVDGTVVWTGSEMIVWGGGNETTDGSKWNTGSRYNPATDTWTTMTTQNAPLARGLHTAIWTGSEMIVWGGCGPFDQDFCALNDGARYNPATDVWIPVSDTGAPSNRLRHTAVWTGSEMIIWGGCAYSTSGTSCHIQNDARRYSPASDSWTTVSNVGAPPATAGRQAVWTGDEMIIWIGAGFGGGRYDPAADSWAAMSAVNEPLVNNSYSVVWTGSELIAWGGCLGNCATGVDGENVGGRYDPSLDTWTATTVTAAPAARYFHTAVWTGSEMIVWGGVSSEQSLANSGGRYDPASDTWTGTTSAVNAPTGRARHHAVWTGDEMIVWGRFTTDASGGRYNPDTNSWTPTNHNEPQSVLIDPTAAWTGSEMLVWGGLGTLGPDNVGDRYNPAIDVWTPMNSGHGLGARNGFASVWTGSELIIWGGAVGNNVQGNGARYNATSDTWTATSTVGAPSARTLHSAVWTGSEMVVWGGQEFNGDTASGARYDPTGNSWTAISAANAPAARRLHTAVWADGDMVVWGGVAGSLGENTGGRYDLAGDSWTATSTASAPSERYNHSATWTGSEMIVFGGLAGPLNNGTYVNSGGRYDPLGDTWSATSTAIAPSPRANHTAVWTGAEMIVWGGCSSVVCSAAVDTGGRYDPVGDGWTPTAQTGAPAARASHSAIWTGDSMIVWGGLTEDGIGITGGAYYLQACGFDLNCDGAVDVVDISLIANHWGCSLGDPCFVARYDLTGDDVITVADVMTIAGQWSIP